MMIRLSMIQFVEISEVFLWCFNLEVIYYNDQNFARVARQTTCAKPLNQDCKIVQESWKASTRYARRKL